MTRSSELAARQDSWGTGPTHGRNSIAKSMAIKAVDVVGEMTRHTALPADLSGAQAGLFSSAGSCGDPRANDDCRLHSQPSLRVQSTTPQTGEC